MEERDDNNNFIVKGKKEKKRLYWVLKNLVTRIDNLSKERNKYDCLIQRTNQLITSKKGIKTYRSSNNKNPKTIVNMLDEKLVDFELIEQDIMVVI